MLHKYTVPQSKKLSFYILNKMCDLDIADFIYKHRTSSSVAFAYFYVNGRHLDLEAFCATFDIRPSHVRYLYEVLHIASARDILEYLRVKHYECSFGVYTLEHLVGCTGKRLNAEQVLNLVGLGKSPADIVINSKKYQNAYNKGLLPQAESSMFA